MVAVQIFDETTTGKRLGLGTMEVEAGEITLADLIEARVRAEFVRGQRGEAITRLVQLHPEEARLNADAHREPLADEIAAALAAFETGQYLVLVDEYQLTSLHAPVALRPESEVTFLRLVPLVGG